MRDVIVPLDGSELSERVIPLALGLATATRVSSRSYRS